MAARPAHHHALQPSAWRPAALPSARPTALRVAPCCSPRVAPCSPHAAPYCPARRALLQPARRALLPRALRLAAAGALRPNAARSVPCLAQPRRPALPSRAAQAELRRPARAALPHPSRAALPHSPAPPSRPPATTAAAARATAVAGGGAAWSARAAAGAGSATDRHCLSWPLSRPGGGGFGFMGTAQWRQQRPQGTFSLQRLRDCASQRCVPGCVEAAALGFSESPAAPGDSECAASLGARESADALGASASTATGPASAEALHNFKLDSGTTRCFLRDCTTVTPIATPVPFSLADPTGDPVVTEFQDNPASEQHVTAVERTGNETRSTGGQVGLYHPPFEKCGLPGSSLQEGANYNKSPLAAASPRHALPSPRHALPSPSRRLSLLRVSSDHCSSADAPHGRVGPGRVSGTDQERYFLLVVDDYPRYTTVFPLRRKADVSGVLIPWIRATHHQLCERFSQDLPVMRLHTDRGGEFSSGLLEEFCQDEGICQTFILPASPQQNGIAECPIGLIIDSTSGPVSLEPETSPTLRWTGKVSDASLFRVWGTLSLVRDAKVSKLSSRTLRCIFLGFPTDTPPWQFYHPRAGRVFSSQDVTFDESVCFYSLHLHASHPVPLAPLLLVPVPPPIDPLPPQGTAPSGVSQVPAGGPGAGQPPQPDLLEMLSSQQIHAWIVRRGGPGGGGFGPAGAGGAVGAGGTARGSASAGGTRGAGGAGVASAGGATGARGTAGVTTRGTSRGAAGAGGTGGTAGAAGAASAGGAAIAGGARAASTGGAASAGGTGAASAGGAAGAGGTGVTAEGARAASAGGVASAGGAGGASAGGAAGAGGNGVAASARGAGPAGALHHLLGLPPAHTEFPVAESLTECRESETRSSTPERREPKTRASVPARVRRVRRPCAPAVPGTHDMTLRPSSVPQRVVLPSPHASSLPDIADPPSDLARASSPTVTRFLAIVVMDPTFSSPVASTLVAGLVDFAAVHRLDYLASLVSDPDPACQGEVALGCNILEDRQEDLECLATAAPHLATMRLAPEGDPDALGIPTLCSYREAISGFNQHEGVDFFQTFSPTPEITLLQVLLDVAAQRDYELHSLDFSTAFLQVKPTATNIRPASGAPQVARHTKDDTCGSWALALVKAELQERHACTDLGELRSYLGLQITRDRARHTITLTQSHMVHQVFQRFDFQFSLPQPTPLSNGQLLAAPPLDESVEPSGLYPELVGCLMYLMTCTRPDLAYPLSLLAHYVAPGRHRKVHFDAAKRVLRYLCSTSGMGLVLGGQGSVVLTGHSDASWADHQASQRSSQGYTFSLGSGSVSWRSTRFSSVLSFSYEAEIYAGALAAPELRWLTYLLTDLGERPHSPPVLYVDNKAMRALCREQRVEHRTKHIALCFFLAHELQQRGQLRLAYVASRANTSDVFTKDLGSGDHQRFCTALGLVPTFPHLLAA
ncbi:unnamed protein product [Closterium sp. NIES-54]